MTISGQCFIPSSLSKSPTQTAIHSPWFLSSKRQDVSLKKGDYFLPNCMSQSKTVCVLSSTGSSRENCLTLVSCLPCPCQKVPPRSTEIFLKTACKVGCLPPSTAQLHPPNFASQPTDKAPCRASSLHTVKTNLRTLSHDNHNTRTHAWFNTQGKNWFTFTREILPVTHFHFLCS